MPTSKSTQSAAPFGDQGDSAPSGADAALEQAADRPSILSLLPDDVVIQEIVDPYLPPDSISMFAEAFSINKAARKSGLFVSLQDKVATALLTVILREENAVNKVAAIIDVNPTVLLNNRGIITDHSGRTIEKRTPLQAALDAGDVAVNDASTGMCEMIMDKIVEHYGEEERRKQYAEWVISLGPNTENLNPKTITDDQIVKFLDVHFARQQSDDEVFNFRAIPATPCAGPTPDTGAGGGGAGDDTTINIIDRIKTAPIDHVESALAKDTSSPLWKDLEVFRDAFDKKSHSEQAFNPYHLLKALEIYNDTFADPPNGWGYRDDAWQRRNLLWRQVIGYVQRFLPACDAQAFAQGLYGVVEKDNPLNRSFNFSYGGGAIYPLLPLTDAVGLGYDVVLMARPCKWVGLLCPLTMPDVAETVITKNFLCKNSRLCEIMHWQPKPPTERPQCVIS